MKLLPTKEAKDKLRKENDDLIETNLRLRGYESQVKKRLGALKEDYEPDKLAKLKEFEAFCKDLITKKGKLLKELSDIEYAIKQKKELYYGLIAKQDALEEKQYELKQKEMNISLREVFVEDIERKVKEALTN